MNTKETKLTDFFLEHYYFWFITIIGLAALLIISRLLLSQEGWLIFYMWPFLLLLFSFIGTVLKNV